MKLLQNSAGNFLNMTPQEAKRMAQQLLEAAEKSLTAAPGRGAGFVHTIVIQEDRIPVVTHEVKDIFGDTIQKNIPIGHGELDTIFVGISPTHLDMHPDTEAELRLRSPHILNINRNDVNVRLKKISKPCTACGGVGTVVVRVKTFEAGRRNIFNPTHCPAGHEFTPENTAHNPHTMARICIECRKARQLFLQGKFPLK